MSDEDNADDFQDEEEEELSDAELERRLFTPASFDQHPARPLPDWTYVHRECKRRGVTLMLLWEEYRSEVGDGYGYSRFCDLYIAWRRGVSATMRQTHVAGEKLFVDYAGDTVPVFDGATGEERRAHVFVAVLGASNYTYAEARWSEGLADWIGSHVNALTFLGGVPKLLVCDNLRAGVTAACRYEPGINRTYQEMAAHYGAAVLPTRVRRPRDKAKVEVAVLIVERFILARLLMHTIARLGRVTAMGYWIVRAQSHLRLGGTGASKCRLNLLHQIWINWVKGHRPLSPILQSAR